MNVPTYIIGLNKSLALYTSTIYVLFKNKFFIAKTL